MTDFEMSRRQSILGALVGCFSSSCASADAYPEPMISFHDATLILQKSVNFSDFIRQTQLEYTPLSFTHDDPDNYYPPFQRSRDSWERLNISNPPGIIQRIEVGTRMMKVEFLFNQPLNPTSGRLFVIVDENDRIIGWLYSRTLVGHEREAMPR